MVSSFSFAINGVFEFFRKERNAKIHLVAAVLVIVAGFYFHVNNIEWILIVIMIMSVFVAEMVNSSMESLCNHLHPDRHEKIKLVKDLSAGAVLIASIAAVIVAAIIFLPKILS